MFSRVAVAALFLSLSACGASSSSFSCNIPASFQCSSVSTTGGTLENTTCAGTVVSACPTADVIGRCTIVTTATQGSSTGTLTAVATFYTGADAAQSEAGCTAAGGTWST